MVSGIRFWAERGRVTVHLQLDYNLGTGELVPRYSTLAVYFDGVGGFVDTHRFDEAYVNVAVPPFEAHEACKADAWVRNYAFELDQMLVSEPTPVPAREQSDGCVELRIDRPDNCATLQSSCGYLVFDITTGEVNRERSELDDMGCSPRMIDVEEWRRRYPTEKLEPGDEHDILDFGIWFDDRDYDPPCEGWRVNREERIREEAEAALTPH